MMEYLPECAAYRRPGTVIVRSMECRCSPGWPRSDTGKPRPVVLVCEHCTRSRLSRYSDCDSGVWKCRPYRPSAARSRYVNVCAAVCLVLLVGNLSQSLAAPHWSRRMERQRRASGTQENSLWANPCDYNDSITKSVLKYSPKLAKTVAVQARNAHEHMEEYKDSLAQTLHNFQSFSELLKVWSTEEWLRQIPWFREEILPKEKVLNQQMPEDDVKNIVKSIDEFLPSMYKTLKMVVASLNALSEEGLNDNVNPEKNLKTNITRGMHDVRAVLCSLSEVMRARDLEVQPLLDSEVPSFSTPAPYDKVTLGLLVYRDALVFLEYMAQVFQTMYVVGSAD